MIIASAYILHVPAERRAVLLEKADENRYFPARMAAEPVPAFDHSKRAPLIVLASFEEGAITHIADGRKGASAGTELVRLNMGNLHELTESLRFDQLKAVIQSRFLAPLQRAWDKGGLIPPKTLEAVVEGLSRLRPEVAPRLARFSERRLDAVRRLSPTARTNLALQKETLGVALEIAGLPKDELLAWSPVDGRPHSFLEGLPSARVREDAMLIADFSNLPGFTAISDATHFAVKTFEDSENPANRLTVVMANRLALEEQTGADLIYFHETYRAFVMVQYKAMEKNGDTHEFRWAEGDQFVDEIARMDTLLEELGKIPADEEPDGFRFLHNPFFLKFCPRIVFNPDDKGLFSGIYVPLGLWKVLEVSGRLKGPRGGNVLSFDNIGRRLTNTEFVTLVANAWVGTTIGQSAVLEQVIRAVLETGKTITFAVKRKSAAAVELEL